MMRSAVGIGFGIVIVLVGFSQAQQVVDEQLLENPSFELGYGNTIEGWTKEGVVRDSALIARSTEHARSGDYSAKLSELTSRLDARRLISSPAPVVGGEEYAFGVWIHVPKVDGGPGRYRVSLQIEWGVEGRWVVGLNGEANQWVSVFDRWYLVELSEHQVMLGVEYARIKAAARVDSAFSGDLDLYLDDAFIRGPAPVKLEISAEGDGKVDVDPVRDRYPRGQRVELVAEPKVGWAFSHWAGDAVGRQESTQLYLDADKAVVAHFVELLQLSVGVDGRGTTSPQIGEHRVRPGVTVQLEAVPAEGWEFSNWDGDVEDVDTPATTMVVDAPVGVTARFVPTLSWLVANSYDEVSLQQAETLLSERALLHVRFALCETADYSEFRAVLDDYFRVAVLGGPILVDTESPSLVGLRSVEKPALVWIGQTREDPETGVHRAAVETGELLPGDYTLHIGSQVYRVKLLESVPECDYGW